MQQALTRIDDDNDRVVMSYTSWCALVKLAGCMFSQSVLLQVEVAAGKASNINLQAVIQDLKVK